MASSHLTLATSRTAEVFALDERRVLKLFHPGAEEKAAREVEIARLVSATGVRCPMPLGRVERDGRPGIIYQRFYGPTIARWVGLRRPWRIHAGGQALAQAHVGLHAYDAPALPSLRERLRRDVFAATLAPPKARQFALRALDALPDGRALCHFDVTIENVMLTADGPVAIDWSEAARGDPAADVARSLIHLTLAHLHDTPPIRRPLALARDPCLASAYLTEYAHLRPDVAPHVSDWLLPIAVARLGLVEPPVQRFLLIYIARWTEQAAAR